MTPTGQWARRLIDLEPKPHPAKFPTEVLHKIDNVVTEEADRLGGKRLKILDNFAGWGRVHHLRAAAHWTYAVELEPEWAMVGVGAGPMIVGDARRLPFPDSTFDAGVASPCYGNRMADSHEARDLCGRCKGNRTLPVEGGTSAVCPLCKGTGLSPRNTYRHKLGRKPTRGSSAVMQWGPLYRQFHQQTYAEWLRVIVPGGLVVVNISNHLKTIGRDDDKRVVEQRVSEWHVNELMAQGCNIVRVDRVATKRNRQGSNHEARVDGELVVVMRAPGKPEVVQPMLTPAAMTETEVRVAHGLL